MVLDEPLRVPRVAREHLPTVALHQAPEVGLAVESTVQGVRRGIAILEPIYVRADECGEEEAPFGADVSPKDREHRIRVLGCEVREHGEQPDQVVGARHRQRGLASHSRRRVRIVHRVVNVPVREEKSRIVHLVREKLNERAMHVDARVAADWNPEIQDRLHEANAATRIEHVRLGQIGPSKLLQNEIDQHVARSLVSRRRHPTRVAIELERNHQACHRASRALGRAIRFRAIADCFGAAERVARVALEV
jgi:hypothetical protein